MILSSGMNKLVTDQEGWTRKMFEAGIRMRKEFGPENVYDFSLGNPDTEPPPELRARLVDRLTSPTPGMHRYMPNSGYEDVRAEIAAYLAERTGLPFTPLHVFMTVGCAGASTSSSRPYSTRATRSSCRPLLLRIQELRGELRRLPEGCRYAGGLPARHGRHRARPESEDQGRPHQQPQ